MTTTDEFLEQLGALEREHDETFPHEWEDVVRGERSADEVVEARRGRDDPKELEALAKLLTPVGATERSAWVDRLAAATEADPDEDETFAPPPTEAKVVNLDERRGSRAWLGTGLAVLLAAGLVLWLVPRDQGVASTSAWGPTFSLTVRNETVHELRSDSDEAPDALPRYLPSSQIHWVIRPERSVTEPLGLRVLVQAHDAPATERRLFEPRGVEVSPRGVVQLRGTMDQTLGLPAGRFTVRLVVGEPASLPADLTALDAGGHFTVTGPYALEMLAPR